MNDVFDYLNWRGDILFTQLPVNPVDALIFSCLSYISYDGILSEDPKLSMPLQTVAKTLLTLPEAAKRCRVSQDLELLEAAAQSRRFGQLRMGFYRSVFIPEEETQFAAMTFFLDNSLAFVVFRGTDASLTGWKEDFNMAFEDAIPAQRLAEQYVRTLAEAVDVPLVLTGHSKGGNLAIFAASKVPAELQERILAVYNQDGPGFTGQMLEDPGYNAMVPKLITHVPRSSVFGMLLERKEEHIVVRSSQVGILQHEPYSWEVMGGDLVRADALSADAVFLDKTIQTWLEGMTRQERMTFIDAVFDLLMTENVSRPIDILKPQNVLTYIKTLSLDENIRRTITAELSGLLQSLKDRGQTP